MRRIFIIFILFVFVIGYFSVDKVNAFSLPHEERDEFSYPIYSQETGKKVGIKTIKTTRKEENLGKNQHLITITSKIANTYNDVALKDSSIETIKSEYLFKNDKIFSINGEEVSELSSDLLDFSLSKDDYSKVKPLADQYKKGIVSYEEYLNKVAKLELDIVNDHKEQIKTFNTAGINANGGLPWVTAYSKSYRGGYSLTGKQMYGFANRGIHGLMLDSDAVKPNTTIYKHNFINSSQGGQVSSFLIRAD